jgi:hypothetical protein
MNTKTVVGRLGRQRQTSMKNPPEPDASRKMLTASCACGSVQLYMIGTPIVCAVCYCDDCSKTVQDQNALGNQSDGRYLLQLSDAPQF